MDIIKIEIYRIKKNKAFWFTIGSAVVMFLVFLTQGADNITARNYLLGTKSNIILVANLGLVYSVVLFYYKKSGTIQEYISFGYRRAHVYISKLFTYYLETLCVSLLIGMGLFVAPILGNELGFINGKDDFIMLVRFLFSFLLLVAFSSSVVILLMMNFENYLVYIIMGGQLLSMSFLCEMGLVSIEELPVALRYSIFFLPNILFRETLALDQVFWVFVSLIGQIVFVNLIGIYIFRKRELK